MSPRFSQWLPGEEVPEKHWMYRLAKKFWFNDFNAYRHQHADAEVRARELKSKLALPSSGPTTEFSGGSGAKHRDQEIVSRHTG